jgi:uncharacterized membrane protein YkvA (DUF1232 family)
VPDDRIEKPVGSKELALREAEPYEHAYSEPRFRDKLRVYALAAGEAVVYRALLLYYAADRSETPKWAKAAVYGALGYFILPVDAMPDLIPGVGSVDDLGALMLAMGTIAAYIDENVRVKARDKLRDWFGGV